MSNAEETKLLEIAENIIDRLEAELVTIKQGSKEGVGVLVLALGGWMGKYADRNATPQQCWEELNKGRHVFETAVLTVRKNTSG